MLSIRASGTVQTGISFRLLVPETSNPNFCYLIAEFQIYEMNRGKPSHKEHISVLNHCIRTHNPPTCLSYFPRLIET